MTDKPNAQYAAAIYQCAKSYNATYYDKDFEDWKRLTAIHEADIADVVERFGVPRDKVIKDSSDCYTKNFMYLREIEAEEAKNRGKWSLRAQIRAARTCEIGGRESERIEWFYERKFERSPPASGHDAKTGCGIFEYE